MKYAVLTYETGRENFSLGDYIQSLAARQYLPRVDMLLNRERLDCYDGEAVKLIMNGWFMSQPEHWPPAPNIHPLPVSFHIQAHKIKQLTGAGKIEYFRRHQSWGCRDRQTMKLLAERGVQVDYTSCLTLTLGRSYHADQSSGKTYFVDVLCKDPAWHRAFSSLKMFRRCWNSGKLFHPWAKQRSLHRVFDRHQPVVTLTQNVPSADYPRPEERFVLAQKRLEEFSHAKLVVTSRIHSALPCLGMGTPVVFVNGGFEPADIAGRVGDFFDLFNTIHIDRRGKIEANFDLNALADGSLRNPTKHLEFARKLAERCERFCAE